MFCESYNPPSTLPVKIYWLIHLLYFLSIFPFLLLTLLLLCYSQILLKTLLFLLSLAKCKGNASCAIVFPIAFSYICILQIINKDFGYVVDGDVFFAVDKFPNYGKLSGQKLENNRAGERVAVDSRKRNPSDFALWKVRNLLKLTAWNSLGV